MANIPMIVVRKAPKAYGAFANEYVEGPYVEGQRVLLLEDIVSNGREVMAAKARLEELNLHVTVYAVINRGLAPINLSFSFHCPAAPPKPKTERPFAPQRRLVTWGWSACSRRRRRRWGRRNAARAWAANSVGLSVAG